ncbi:MAG: cytochrome c3 family protein [Deltaproteobacteria bacterium]|nr:cytochrome c3 family protein [Deltaproteobacteria bacterium]
MAAADWPGGRRAWAALGGATAVLLGGLFYVYAVYPGAGIGPRQPISFSHRVHAGVKRIPCRFCHPYVERSAHAGLPTVKKCFYCHAHVIPSHPEILREKGYLEARVPVPWVRLFVVPDHVKFRHQPHVAWAKIDCSACHGAVATMDRLRPVKFQMGFCIGCHRARGAQLDCWLACHH